MTIKYVSLVLYLSATGFIALTDESRAEVSRYAKNFLPIFFNLYTTEPEKEKQRDTSRMAVLETLKCYIKITDQEVSTYTTKV